MKEFAYKILGRKYTWLAREYNQAKTLLYSFSHPYNYCAKRYSDTFLKNDSLVTDRDFNKENVDRIIYVFWTGDNEITPNRLAGIDSLEKYSCVKVKLITKDNLDKYIKPDFPLHKAYPYLSCVHKADYLRCYFMHFYGGGYADIKKHQHSWIDAFNKLDTSDAYAISYREIGFDGAATIDMKEDVLKEDVHNYWRLLMGICSFICRPKTKFTDEWFNEVNRRLDDYFDALVEHPASEPYGGVGYPVKWTIILGAIYHPLCLKYWRRIIFDSNLKPSFKNYR